MSTATRPIEEDQPAHGLAATGVADRTIVVIAWGTQDDVRTDTPEIAVFRSADDLRVHVQRLQLGDVELCRAMARSYRRLETVLDGGRLARMRASDMLPDERRFLQRLLRARRDGELCCGDADDRWLAWFQRQHAAWVPPLNALWTVGQGVDTIERLAASFTPLSRRSSATCSG